MRRGTVGQPGPDVVTPTEAGPGAGEGHGEVRLSAVTDKAIPAWQRRAAVGLFVAVVALVGVFWSRIAPDFWPPDSSRVGPNMVAAAVQAAVLFVALILLWPPWRRRAHRFVDSKLAPLHARVEQLHARHDEHASSLADLHSKLDALTDKEKP